MNIKTSTMLAAAIAAACALPLPKDAQAAYYWGDSYGDRGQSAINNSGCFYNAYVAVTQYVWGTWPASLWHSNNCGARVGQFWLDGSENQSWRPARYVAVGLAGTNEGFYYYYTGYGNYFSPIRYYQATQAVAACGAVSFGSMGSASNCSYSGP